ncbi:hypothetical protein D068_cds08070 [Bacillus atrophaeus UCMB-5137]|nr:hypothetical protein D068_cds08070 [Bacillus atrophaeus UCMB-5137]
MYIHFYFKKNETLSLRGGEQINLCTYSIKQPGIFPLAEKIN